MTTLLILPALAAGYEFEVYQRSFLLENLRCTMGAALGLEMDGWRLLRISVHSLEVYGVDRISIVLMLGVMAHVVMATSASF
jgi:hypothetical protein